MTCAIAYHLKNDLTEVLSYLDKLHFIWKTGRRLTKYQPSADKPYPAQINLYFEVDNAGLHLYCTRSSEMMTKYPFIKNYHIVKCIIDEIQQIKPTNDMQEIGYKIQQILESYV